MNQESAKREAQVRNLHDLLTGMLDQGYYWPSTHSGINMFEHAMDTFIFRHEAQAPFQYGLTVALHQPCGQEPLHVYVSWRLGAGRSDRLIITDTAASNNLSLVNGVFKEHTTNSLSQVIEGLLMIVERTTLERFSAVCATLSEEPHHATRTLPEA